MSWIPASWSEAAALVSIIGAILGLAAVIARSFHKDITRRIDAGTKRLDSIEAWQKHMEDSHLPATYARRDIVDHLFRESKESNERVEALIKETKDDFRDSLHALRNDLIALVRRRPPLPPPVK